MNVALTIAGSDSGGGAGVQADLRAFACLGVFGTSAITAITAQNPHRVTAVSAVPPEIVQAQVQAVFAAFTVGAVKTGMLFDAGIINAVADVIESLPRLPLVVDPVMVATSGARLLREDAVAALVSRLLPVAGLITPNLPEAAVLLGLPADAVAANPAAAAHELSVKFACGVLVKGGHSSQPGTDFLAFDNRLWELRTPAVETPATHGTGCALSAAAAACLAAGDDLLTAVRRAKAYVYAALQAAVEIGPGGLRGMWLPPGPLDMDSVVCQELQ